jgi:hypothetical protein
MSLAIYMTGHWHVGIDRGYKLEPNIGGRYDRNSSVRPNIDNEYRIEVLDSGGVRQIEQRQMGKMIHESYPFSPMLVVSIQVIATT